MKRHITRRAAVAGLAAAGSLTLTRAPFAQTLRPIRIGHLHIPTCDAQMWLMKELDTYRKEGLEPTFTRFNTGIEGFSALVGGSVDVFTTGGVTHNFPARGQGIVVLPNCIEWGGQVFGREDLGVKKIQDLKGKKIATTLGTTGQIILYTALKRAGLDPVKDVDIVSQTMPAAVTSYVTGSLPALSTWVPFNLRAREAKTSVRLAEAREFGPDAGFVVAAYSSTQRIIDSDPDLIRRLIAAWGPANEMMIQKKDESALLLQEKYYKNDMGIEDMRANFDAMELHTTSEWTQRINDKSLEKQLDSVTDIFVQLGAIKGPLPASKYSNFAAYLDVFKA